MNNQLSIFDSFSSVITRQNQNETAFKPPKGKIAALLRVMQSGNWYTPLELCNLTGISPLSITARVRDLRKESFGAHIILNQEDSRGTRYKLLAADSHSDQ